MIRNRKRLWALLLSAALVVAQLPAVAMAENAAPDDKVNFTADEREGVPGDGSITSFEPLDDGVANQTVDVGTGLSALDLPGTVTAKVCHVTEDAVIPDEDDMEEENDNPSIATPGDADQSVLGSSTGGSHKKVRGETEKTATAITTTREEIPVTWDSEPVYDGDTEGTYVFTAKVDGYVLSGGAKLPQITVTVTADTAGNPTDNPTGETRPCTQTEGCTLSAGHEGDCVPAPPANDALVKTITGWAFVATDYSDYLRNELAIPGVSQEHQADFDTVVSMLPTQISAEIGDEEKPAILDITSWGCPAYRQDGNHNWPLTGEYTFTAELPEGYACDPSPAVRVMLGGMETYGLNNSITAGNLTVSASNGGGVEYADDSGFTLKTSGTYEISGTWNGSLDTSGGADQDVITVPNGVTADVTLNAVEISANGIDEDCAFAVAAGGVANITLSGENTLVSSSGNAGLEVPENASVSIDGSGSLTARGGFGGAGIGGSEYSNSGSIEINGGTIVAVGHELGAGIGGGNRGSGTTTTISGGMVKATSRDYLSGVGSGGAAGIGGGNLGSGGTISISGGIVEAKGGATSTGSGAGIGGGYGGSGGTITISGGNLTAVGGGSISVVGGSGIGSGSNRDYYGGNGIITISGGNLTASGGEGGESGAGIGGGAYSGSGTITITGGSLTANGRAGGAGIGSGFSSDRGGTITITGGSLTANGGSDADLSGGAGIGSGGGITSTANNIPISISNGTVKAYGGDGRYGGAGIGGGLCNYSGTIAISGGMIHAEGGTGSDASGAGIGDGGAPSFGTAEDITVDGNPVVFAKGGGTGANAIGGSKNSTDVTVPNLIQGVVFEGKQGTVHGSPTLPDDMTIPPDYVLTVPADGILTNNHTLTNDGILDGTGILTGAGIFDGDGIYKLKVRLNRAAVKDIKPPAIGDLPDTTATVDSRAGYTAGAVTWDGALASDGSFGYNTAYTANVTLTAKKAYQFDGSSSGTINGQAANASRISGAEMVLSYTFDRTGAQAWAVTVNNGTSDKTTAIEGETVTITAGAAPAGKTFDKWTTEDGVPFTDEHAAETTFIMPAKPVTVTAAYKNIGSSSSGSGSSYTEPRSIYITAGDRISQAIPRSDLKKLADSGRNLALRCDNAGMTFTPAALKAVLAATTGASDDKATFSAAPADISAFQEAAELIGACPVYDFMISYRDHSGRTAAAPLNFPAGSASVFLNYAPISTEVTGSLFMVYVDGMGAVTWLDKSGYKVNDTKGGREGTLERGDGKVLADVPTSPPMAWHTKDPRRYLPTSRAIGQSLI